MSQPDRPPTVVRRRLSPFQISLSGMALIVTCCAAALWSFRKVQEYEHPSIARARTLRSGDRDERLQAARFFLVSDPGDPKFTAAALIGALDDNDLIVRSEAVHALGVVAKRLGHPAPSRRRAAPALQALAKVLLDRPGDARTPDPSNLSRALGDPVAPTGAKPHATRLARTFTGTDISESGDLAQVLNDPSWMAARALGEVASNTDCDDIALDALAQALRTDDDERRLKVITRSLGRFGPAADEVVPDLIRALRKAVAARGASDEWLWIIADTLVRIAPGTGAADEAIAALRDCLRSRDDQERQVRAVKVLTRLGASAHPAVPDLIAIMKESQTKTASYVGRQWVPEALGKIAPGTPSAAAAIDALAEALDVNDVDLRLGALQALSRFGPAAKVAVPRLEALKKAKVFPDLADQVLKAIVPGR
jgi:hypothetical protein